VKRSHLAVAASLTAVTMSLSAVTMCLTACGSADPESAGAPAAGVAAPKAVSAEHNDADVMFLQMMITHHTQGLVMVRVAEKEVTRPEVKDLVTAINLTQSDEVKAMTDWLARWNKPAMAALDAGAHAGHGGMPATSPDVIADLAVTKGAMFESKFLTLFTGHQGAAVEMAQRELKEGASKPVRELADRIVKSRTGQIQQMLGILNEQ
jgi:uncharacterized protein (DUF305 family)